jgi:hypothetical protein
MYSCSTKSLVDREIGTDAAQAIVNSHAQVHHKVVVDIRQKGAALFCIQTRSGAAQKLLYTETSKCSTKALVNRHVLLDSYSLNTSFFTEKTCFMAQWGLELTAGNPRGEVLDAKQT